MRKKQIVAIVLVLCFMSLLYGLTTTKSNELKGLLRFDDDYVILPEVGRKEKDTIENYSDLTDLLTNSNIEVPIYENLIPQGIAIVDDYIFITVYDNFGLTNSKVYVIDASGSMLNVATLDNNSHVGGIAYDKQNDLLWIPDNDGILNAYKKDDILNKDYIFYKYRFEELSEELIDFKDPQKHAIDFLTINEDYLFIGSFALEKNGVVKKYKINKIKNSIELEFVNKFKVREKVQGISFFNDYMILSTSYGRKKTSKLYVYKYREDKEEYTKKALISYKLPAMLEQITVDKDELYLIFENTAKKYHDSIDKIGYICVLDVIKTVKYEKKD